MPSRWERPPPHAATDLRRFGGRTAAVLAVATGAMTLLDAWAVPREAWVAWGLAGTGAAAVLSGVVAWSLPWHRWCPSALIALIPLTLVLVGVGNLVDPDPTASAPFCFLIATWLGMTQRRGVVLALTPAIAAGYWLPLAAAGQGADAASSVPYLALACAVGGEATAWLTARLARAHQALRDHDERRFEALLAASSDVTAILDRRAAPLYVSPAIQKLLGIGPLGTDPEENRARFVQHVDPADLDAFLALFAELRRVPGASGSMSAGARHADGTRRDLDLVVRNLLDDPDVGGVLVTIRDVTERCALERALQRRADHDALTGLANRARFTEELVAAADAGRWTAVLFCDLDGFKAVNDLHGHHTGDRVLVAVADRLRALAPPGATVARLGGDEFTVLLTGGDAATVEAAAVELAGQVVAACRRPVVLDELTVRLGVSVGFATGGGGVPPPLDLLGAADLAMLEAKASGRGTAVRYSPTMRHEVLDRLSLRQDLATALEREELVVHYQPIVAAADGRPLGYEALLRWRHPTRGDVPPAEFVPAAEATGLIVPIGRWLLAEAGRFLAQLEQASLPGPAPYVAVNLSAVQLADPGLPAHVAAALAAARAHPSRLVLELTEGLVVDGPRTVVRLEELKALGVRLAVDDFGTGYSSLRYLGELPLDILKVDRSFVARLDESPDDPLVAAILTIGRSLGLATVAEGVETGAQAATLRRLGADALQGFLFGEARLARCCLDALGAPATLSGSHAA